MNVGDQVLWVALAVVVGDEKLLGGVVGRVEGMEKSVFAIPATDIPKAITRMIEALSKQ